MTDIVVRVANTMPNLLLLMVNCTLSQDPDDSASEARVSEDQLSR